MISAEGALAPRAIVIMISYIAKLPMARALLYLGIL